ncbi:hypothetical protein BofuT4_uP115170.1 [Botrytis cinerea T4]|uniref:Uncharacterized protein n=1 Tax=Botryotinia fuckeliana (strain T4) TaxID=999810 RepID=G2Y2C1_BOTF4|nr:hypothetical protein BofuT4_uP115170.1 [Botrytis cinerea T4]
MQQHFSEIATRRDVRRSRKCCNHKINLRDIAIFFASYTISGHYISSLVMWLLLQFVQHIN